LSLIESVEKRIERLEFWQKIELIMLSSLIGEKAIQIIASVIS